MITDKPEVTTEKIATTKTPAVEKKTEKPDAKRAAKKPDNTIAKPAPKKSRVKVVCDFSIPLVEYQKIAEIKEACLKAGLHAKKSEVIRAGLKILGEMNGEQIKRVIVGMEKTKVSLHS